MYKFAVSFNALYFLLDFLIQLFYSAGIASGPIQAFVIGNTVPKYTLFGPTLSIAKLMEASSDTMRIQCSAIICNLLEDSDDFYFDLEKRATSKPSKSHKKLQTWWLNDMSSINSQRKSIIARRTSSIIATLQGGDIEMNDDDKMDRRKIMKDKKVIPKSFRQRKSDQFGSVYFTNPENENRTSDYTNEYSIDCDTNGESPTIEARRRQSNENSVHSMVRRHSQNSSFMEFFSNLALENRTKNIHLEESKKNCFKRTKVVVKNPKLLIICFLVFIFLLGFGIFVVTKFSNIEDSTKTRNIVLKADTFSSRIVSEIEKYIVPLYTLKQFVSFLDIFDQMPLILSDTTSGKVRDTCTSDSDVTDAFYNISSSIMKTFDVDIHYSPKTGHVSHSTRDDVILNLQLLPNGTSCLFFPKIGRTKDNLTFDYTSMVGHNYIDDSSHEYIRDPKMYETIFQAKGSGAGIFEGPYELISKDRVYVKQIMAASLPIFKSSNLEIDSKNRTASTSFWGFSSGNDINFALYPFSRLTLSQLTINMHQCY